MLVVLVAVSVVLGAAVLSGAFAGTSRGEDAFNSARWRSHVACGENSVRLRMLDRLLDDHLERGMTRGEVRRLLGRPDYIDDTDRTKGWSYGAGTEEGNWDCTYLYVGFDRNGRLVEWWDWVS